MYAVTGITGHVGRVAANLLLEKNPPVRAVLRDPVKGDEWKNKGTEVAIAELHDAVSLENSIKNTSGVFVMIPPLFDSDDPLSDHNRMLDALVTAIKKAIPEKVVYLSSVGAHLENGTGAIRKLYDMEQAFKTLDIQRQVSMPPGLWKIPGQHCLCKRKQQAAKLFESAGFVNTHGFRY